MQLRSRNVPSAASMRFRRFPELPPELRLMIWRMTVEPRRVTVRHKTQKIDKRLPPEYQATHKQLALMHTCHESRQALLPLYRLASDRIWVNYDLDTICVETGLAEHNPYSGFKLDTIAHVRCLSITFSNFSRYAMRVVWLAREMPRLENLEIVDTDQAWEIWSGFLDLWYEGDEAVSFQTTIICLKAKVGQTNWTSENYVELRRAHLVRGGLDSKTTWFIPA